MDSFIGFELPPCHISTDCRERGTKGILREFVVIAVTLCFRSGADEETKTEYSRGSNRYIKGGQAGRRGPGGGWHQSARAQLEREYMKSSAMSDTSEAPSLGEFLSSNAQSLEI